MALQMPTLGHFSLIFLLTLWDLVSDFDACLINFYWMSEVSWEVQDVFVFLFL